jgi:predicted O-methyltransferase YrrM
MNKILEQIITNNEVETVDGEKIKLNSQIATGEGLFLQDIISSLKPGNSLEVGFAYGISTLFICESLTQVGAKKHIVIDPAQRTGWKGIGIKNIGEAGYGSIVELIEEPSELALPNLLRNNTHIDFAFIDGWHTFDQALLDFYYINRMLNINGIVAFDDADWPSIYKVCCYLSRYPGYRIYSYWPAAKPISHWLSVRMLAKAIYCALSNKASYLENDLALYRRRCVAFQKVNEDKRNFDWFQEF